MTAVLQALLIEHHIGGRICCRFCRFRRIMKTDFRRMLGQAIAILIGYLQALTG